MESIFKDIYYTAGTSALTFEVRIGDDTIFNGRAYRYPDYDGVRINISRICADYLNNNLTSLNDGSYTSDNGVISFGLYSNDILLQTYEFVYDWSYDNSFTSNRSRPVNGHYAAGQKVLNTVLNGSVLTNTISTQGASNYCGEYALIYLNSYGGWDSFLIEGKVEKLDNYNLFQTVKSYNNTSYEFGKDRYVNEITTQYNLYTSWLTDSQSENIAKNLISSNKVYLQKIGEWIKPVVITDTQAVYKQYRNEKEPVYYEIVVEESQTKERR